MHQNGARAEPGFVYVARNEHLYKIGVSFFPEKRLRRLRSGASAAPRHERTAGWRHKDLILVCVIPTANMQQAERMLWDRFAAVRCDNYLMGVAGPYKSTQQSEWFKLSEQDAAWLASLDHI